VAQGFGKCAETFGNGGVAFGNFLPKHKVNPSGPDEIYAETDAAQEIK